MHIIQEALAFDDILLVPAHSTVLPRDVDLSTQLTRAIKLNIPLVAAAMDTVTESRLAISIAQEGGIGIIHKNMTTAQQANEVRIVKKFESGVIKEPITVAPNISIHQLTQLTHEHNISGVPVVDGDELVGIVTSRDVRFETNLEDNVSKIMTPKNRLVTVNEDAPQAEAIKLLHKHRIEKVLIVNKNFHLRGMITAKDIQKAKDYPNACKDHLEQLRVGAAVGTGQDTEERIEALVTAGVDVIVVDTAHGHSQGVLDIVSWIKQHYPYLQLIGGNIATATAAKALVAAGVDGVKVGIGPGSICTTRIISGVGVPQITAVHNVAKALLNTGVPLIADGGIRYSGDGAKALAAGAYSIMMGGIFAGTEEAPGEIELYQGRSYKSYRGMGSLGAMSQQQGSSDRYFQNEYALEKLVPEGIEGRVPYKGSALSIIEQLLGGIRSSMGYTGNRSIKELHTNAEFVRVTNAGVRESHVHDVVITKESPNYRKG